MRLSPWQFLGLSTTVDGCCCPRPPWAPIFGSQDTPACWCFIPCRTHTGSKKRGVRLSYNLSRTTDNEIRDKRPNTQSIHGLHPNRALVKRSNSPTAKNYCRCVSTNKLASLPKNSKESLPKRGPWLNRTSPCGTENSTDNGGSNKLPKFGRREWHRGFTNPNVARMGPRR